VALSASIGSNNKAIQNVIDSLKIKNIELRTEKDPDLQPFLFNKQIKIVEIETSKDLNKIKGLVEKLLAKRVDILKKLK
jgi:Fanconi anemia group M protein